MCVIFAVQRQRREMWEGMGISGIGSQERRGVPDKRKQEIRAHAVFIRRTFGWISICPRKETHPALPGASLRSSRVGAYYIGCVSPSEPLDRIETMFQPSAGSRVRVKQLNILSGGGREVIMPYPHYIFQAKPGRGKVITGDGSTPRNAPKWY
ncbi:hypothetical protein C8R44DRAFT_749855 [Mycena epipterygia]|nr:hypothetical protein C8R44DRAFT_749855 [Mycena epipterygia]